jgi:proton-coupled amino acid transporter
MGVGNGLSKGKTSEVSPLLPVAELRPDLSSSIKTFFNIVITVVGAGVLGLPYAFKQSGWLQGLLILAATSGAMYYCMMLMVWCRRHLETQGIASSIGTYSELGFHTLGTFGQISVDAMIVLSQGGFCVAYLIFIGENLASVISGGKSPSPELSLHLNLDFLGVNWKHKEVYIWIIFPLQVLLAFIRSLTRLGNFSIFADIVNWSAMAVVMITEFAGIVTEQHHQHVVAFTGWGNLLFSIGVAIYAVEGICLVLPLESECEERSKFPGVLAAAMCVITFLYISFGVLGYLAYGEFTKDIVTLNLGNSWQTVIVKLCLCTALVFTYPVMMHPVYEVAERRICQGRPCQILRTVMVLTTAWIAVSVPQFGFFLSLVGSSVCTLLSFVLPAWIHLRVFGDEMSMLSRAFDWFFIVGGIVFGILGTRSSLADIGW